MRISAWTVAVEHAAACVRTSTAACVCVWRVRAHALHMRLHDNGSHVYEKMRSVHYYLCAAPHLHTCLCMRVHDTSVHADCGGDAARRVV